MILLPSLAELTSPLCRSMMHSLLSSQHRPTMQLRELLSLSGSVSASASLGNLCRALRLHTHRHLLQLPHCPRQSMHAAAAWLPRITW